MAVDNVVCPSCGGRCVPRLWKRRTLFSWRNQHLCPLCGVVMYEGPSALGSLFGSVRRNRTPVFLLLISVPLVGQLTSGEASFPQFVMIALAILGMIVAFLLQDRKASLWTPVASTAGNLRKRPEGHPGTRAHYRIAKIVGEVRYFIEIRRPFRSWKVIRSDDTGGFFTDRLKGRILYFESVKSAEVLIEKFTRTLERRHRNWQVSNGKAKIVRSKRTYR